MVYCTVCLNNNVKHKNISYFCYPRDSTRREQWLKAVSREDLIRKLADDKASDQYRICEEHFDKSYIKFSENRTRKYLYANAFPTLNLPTNERLCSSLRQCEEVSTQENIQFTPTIEIPSSSNNPFNQILILEDETSCSIKTEPDTCDEYATPESGSTQTALHIAADTPRKRKLSPEFQEAKSFRTMSLKLYSVADGPPSFSCRQVLEALNVPFELVDVSFIDGEHMTEDYAKMNPQKEIPVLDDDGFYLSESVAIMQYICDKYQPGTPLYPTDPKTRAIVNHRLCFNLSTYYNSISGYTLAPIFFDYQRTPFGLKRVHMALSVFETYLERLGTSYAAADYLTIADFPLINTTMTLEAIDLDFSEYKKITKWYNDFKKNHPDLWKISAEGIPLFKHFAANPPDLTHLNHPLHPAKKIKQES